MTAVFEERRAVSRAKRGGSPRRLAHVITKFVAGAGGITLRGALALDRSLYSVTILAPEGGSMLVEAERAGFDVVRLNHMSAGLSPREDWRGVGELIGHLRRGNYDIVHTHSAKAGAIGRIAAHRVGVPAIIHSIHGFPFHEFQSAARRRSYLAFERRLAKFTDYFVTDGTYVAAEAVRLKIAVPERIRAIASPVDSDIPRASERTRAEARRLLGVSEDVKVVGTVARLDSQKAPQDLVAALSILARPDVVSVWVGDGELRPRIERLIARKGLSGRVLLLGDRLDVPALLPGLDIFAMPSLYEGLPCAVVEAMVCGIPVVATAVNSVPEVVIPGKTGLLARPSDPGSFARALAFLLDHPDEGARMARAARIHIGDRFSSEALGRDLTEIYQLALTGNGPHAEGWPGARGEPTSASDAPALRSMEV